MNKVSIGFCFSFKPTLGWCSHLSALPKKKKKLNSRSEEKIIILEKNQAKGDQYSRRKHIRDISNFP